MGMARGYGEPVLMPIIVQIDAYDPVTAGPVTLRMASDDDTAVCHLNGQVWWPVLDRLPVLAMDFFGGEFGQVTTAAASLSLAVEPWPDFARYAFPDARLQIWHGDAGAAWAGYTLRFDGRVTSQPVIEDGRAQVGFAVDDKWLDTPMLATYAGTGGAEGPAAMKGTVKPLAIGAPMGVPGVMLDPIKSILQLSAYGAIESVDVPLERLARQFGSPIADYATYAALDAAAVPAGQWATAKAVGLVKMGAPPYGKLCFLMKGDKGGVDGWVRRPGAIIKRYAGLSGGAAKVSEAAVDALDAARPYDLSAYYDGQITAREAIQEIAASVNAVAGVSLTGHLIVVPIQINAAGLTLNADGSSLPIVGSVRALGISAPWWRLAIGAQPFFDVHGQGEYFGFQITAKYPESPPEVMQDGGSYFDETNKQYRYIGPRTFTDEGDIISDEGLVTSSGYEDIQDLAIGQALADAKLGITAAGAAQNSADMAQITADAANAAIAMIDDDDFLTISEKVETLIPGAAAFEALYAAVSANASTAGVSVTTLNTRRTAWLGALAAISPAWNDVSVASPVVRGSLDTARSQYDSELKEVQKLAIEAMTAAKQVVVVPPVAQIVYRDWLGAVKSSQYPRTLTPRVERGGIDIRTSNDATYSISVTGTISATVNNTTGSADKGRISVTGGSSGSIILTVTVSGVAQPAFTIPFTNQDDNPPTTGGGGGGANTGGSDSTLEDVTSTSFAAITQQDGGESVFLIDITSGQTINGTAPLTYTKTGTNGTATAMVAKWQYRLQGSGTWLDFAGSSVTGTGAFWNSADFIAEPGEIAANQSKSGLATGTYEVQLVAAKTNSAAGNLQVVSGAATVSKS